MRWKLLAALLSGLVCLDGTAPAIARQGQISVSRQQDASYRGDVTPTRTTRKPEAEAGRRVETARHHERLLNRKPEEIIPDICIGC